jgi:hypothetical protein
VRKAPKLDAKPIDALFAMAMVRNGLKGWVSSADHQKIVEELAALRQNKQIAPPDDRDDEIRGMRRKIERYEHQVKAFEEASGVRLDLSGYDAGTIGAAVKLVVMMKEHGQPLDALGGHVAYLSTQAAELQRRATGLAEAAVTLRRELDLNAKDHTPLCSKKQGWNSPHCSCGKVPGSPLEIEVAERLVADLERRDS